VAGHPYTNQVEDQAAKRSLIAAFDLIVALRSDLDTATASLATTTAAVTALQQTVTPSATTRGGSTGGSGGGVVTGSFNPGDLLGADASATVVGIPDVAVGNVLISTGSGVPPTYGKVNLTQHVTGTLPIGSGGTNSGAALSGSTIIISNGTGIVQGAAGTATTVLHGNAGGAPTYSAVSLTADVSGTLPVANGGTGQASAISIPAVYGTGRVTGQTAAVASVAAFTVGGADASFLISANVLITASVTHSFSVTCTYTDEGGTSRVLTLNFSQLTGTFVTTLTNILGASAYEGVPVHIRAKAATSITIATTGTFTSVTYNVEGRITQL
jgi:hypothetical protein